MRWSLLALVVVTAACSQDVESGPTFGSGASGATTASGTAADTAGSGDADGGSGEATSSAPETSAEASGTPNTTSDSNGPTSSAVTSDGETTSGGVSSDTSTDGGEVSGSGTPLDPDLDVPDGGEPCTTPGNLAECPSGVCRFHTVEENLCESCVECGNLGAPCTDGLDCDILFACYAGRCTNICPLGTFYCGPVEDCLDVGHPTHGVCDPFA